MRINAKPDMRSSWPEWADFLQRHALTGFASWLLEAAAPVTLLGAQLVNFGAPFLRSTLPEEQLNALSYLLEDGNEGKAFVTFLRERGTA